MSDLRMPMLLDFFIAIAEDRVPVNPPYISIVHPKTGMFCGMSRRAIYRTASLGERFHYAVFSRDGRHLWGAAISIR